MNKIKENFIFIVCNIILGIILFFGITWIGFILQAFLAIGLFIILATVGLICLFIPIALAFEIITKIFEK